MCDYASLIAPNVYGLIVPTCYWNSSAFKDPGTTDLISNTLNCWTGLPSYHDVSYIVIFSLWF